MHTGPGGAYADLELQHASNPLIMEFLRNLVQHYTLALEKNLDNRFKAACPALQAFSVFDPTCPPNPTENHFKTYGEEHIIQVLSEQFQFDEDQALA